MWIIITCNPEKTKNQRLRDHFSLLFLFPITLCSCTCSCSSSSPSLQQLSSLALTFQQDLVQCGPKGRVEAAFSVQKSKPGFFNDLTQKTGEYAASLRWSHHREEEHKQALQLPAILLSTTTPRMPLAYVNPYSQLSTIYTIYINIGYIHCYL